MEIIDIMDPSNLTEDATDCNLNIHLKTCGHYQVPNWSYGQKSQFIRGCVIFGLVNF